MHHDAVVSLNSSRRALLRASAAFLATSAGLAPTRVDARQGPPDLPSTAGPTSKPEPRPSFVRPRETWGAAPPARPYVPHTPAQVVFHHSGAAWYGQPSAAPYLRGMQAFHTGPEREWEDIAYHFLIDLDGAVWAGRPPEVRGNPSVYYDAMGFVLICFLGDYDRQVPTGVQLEMACATAAWVIRRFTLGPDALVGHRDLAPTACPGGNLYRLVQEGALRARVRALLGGR